MTKRYESRITCSIPTRELVKAQKRGGESYDELLQKMVGQFDPEPPETPGDGVIQGEDTKIPCSVETRKAVKALKCGDETYDELLQRMVTQYDPAEAAPDPLSGETATGRG